jgi:dTDP-glucose 4,6-dehydratase
MMRHVLVTGGAGFIGCNFIRYLLRSDSSVQIHNLDALTYSGSLENLCGLPDENRHTFIHGDICNRDLVSKLLIDNQIDTVIHFAAESHVDRSIVKPDDFIQTNIVGTFTILDCAKNYWIQSLHRSDRFRFHHISTDEVYGTLAPGEAAWTEDSPYAPNSPYSASKAASDHLVRSYGHTYGLPFTMTNCSNNYGPYQFPEKLIPLMIIHALSGKPLPVYGDGMQIRDWVHVEDHCEAVAMVAKNAKTGSCYNVGGDNQSANLQIVQSICRILDELHPRNAGSYAEQIQFITDRPGHDRRYAMDIHRITQDLGWRPRHTFEDGLRETVIWYLEHPEWIEAIRKQNEYQAWMDKNYGNRKG